MASSRTRTEIGNSIEATRAELSRLSTEQFEAVRASVQRELEEFIRNEWLPSGRACRAAQSVNQAAE